MGYFSDRQLDHYAARGSAPRLTAAERFTQRDVEGESATDAPADGLDAYHTAMMVERYKRLAAASTPGHCFVCGRRRRTVTALVLGPNSTGVGGPLAGRGHGVCRPCVTAGEATSLR